MGRCPLYCAAVDTVSSSTRVTAMNPCTFMSNAIIARPSSGSTQYVLPTVTDSRRTKLTRLMILSAETTDSYWIDGMNSSTVETRPPTATSVTVTDQTLSVGLSDGRTISAPIAWYPRLMQG